MGWTNAIEDILQRYGGQGGAPGGANPAAAPANPHQDFQQVAQAAPPDLLSSGISQAFHSGQTPPFPEMLSNLFSHSDPNQRAGVLNRLLGTLSAGGFSGLPGLGSLSSLFSGGKVTPDQANQVSPAQVQQIAEHAQRQNPSIVDEISGFYAQHPEIMKAAGALALTIAVQHILKNR